MIRPIAPINASTHGTIGNRRVASSSAAPEPPPQRPYDFAADAANGSGAGASDWQPNSPMARPPAVYERAKITLPEGKRNGRP